MISNPEKTQKYEDELKEKYGINKNISNQLSSEQQKEILQLIENNDAISKLVRGFVVKNKELSNNNRKIGRQREDAKRKLNYKEEENQELATKVSQLRQELKILKQISYSILTDFKKQLTQDMLSRSEIITTVEELMKVFKVKTN